MRPALLSLLVGIVSLAASLAVGARFDDLPPAYHDEYSYLFQARTFLAGQVSFPSHVAARLFDQMHVLNEGQFASRYFPGAGLWMAPFVAAGHPYWGHWLAGGICAALMFWIARELAGDAAGLIAGLVTALSPGMALFSNLLLAHHPTLVGLGIFVLGFLRMVRSANWGWGLISGTGLAFAMICRPMTAAGVALPFGIWFLYRCLRWLQARRRAGDVSPRIGRPVLSLAAALALPLILTLASLFPYNKSITGDGWLTPYSQYTSLHTPSHVYGFNNVERGRQHQGPRVIENYDKWAENLTPVLAITNAGIRWSASWKWTLGLMPMTLALCGGLVLCRRLPAGTWLIFAAILSLHAVHIPYWFVGMEDQHYVFEAGPLWAVWVAVVTVEAARVWNATGQRMMFAWWAILLAAAVVMNWTIGSGQPTALKLSAPLKQGIERVAFARRKHGRFAQIVARRAVSVPALVLVEADPADRHIDYVSNSPDLQSPVLIGHYLPNLVPIAEVRRLFPDRKLFLYRVRQDQWRSLD
jgi:4-amino-4-deoxy-L-arabinose transferase-like glycosyltransferase